MSKFRIEVTRIGYATRVIEVEADSQADAQRIALDTAGDHPFIEYAAEYELAHGSRANLDSPRSKPKNGGV